jgi:alpha-tubulin suppressor-like RCC1 family protein
MVVFDKAWLSKAVLMVAVLCAASGCGDLLGGSTDDPVETPNNEISELPPVVSVGVRPDVLDISVGHSTRMTLYVRDATGRSLEPHEYETRWTSDNPDIVSVDQDGQIHAHAPGMTRVNAFVRGEKGWVEVWVSRQAGRIDITGPTTPLVPGESVRLEAAVWSDSGVRMRDAAVTWAMVETDAASIRQGGIVRAERPGHATITAMYDGVAGRFTLTIGDYDVRGIRVDGVPERLAAGESATVEPLAVGPEDHALVDVDVKLTAVSDNIEIVDDHTIRARRAGWAQIRVDALGHIEHRELLVYEPFTDLSAGRTHACAIDAERRAFCWGPNTHGQLGTPVEESLGRPVLVSESLRFDSISAGSHYTCGVTTDHELYCWGTNRNGKLGDGTNTQRNAPTLVAGDIEWSSVSTGASHTCGLSTSGQAYCWGSNKSGENLGTGLIGDKWTPQPVSGDHDFAQISVGLDHTCALEQSTGRAWCWGNNEYLQLGLDASRTVTDDGQPISRVPLLVSGDMRFSEVHASLAHSFSCGMTTGGEVACWGDNRRGALLEGGSEYPVREERNPLQSALPVAVHDDPTYYADVDLGAHACGIREGDIYCWTDGFHIVQVHPYLPPPKQYGTSRLTSLSEFETVAAGQKFTCGISDRGELYCAGATYQRFAESQGFSPSKHRLYRLLRPDLPEYARR